MELFARSFVSAPGGARAFIPVGNHGIVAVDLRAGAIAWRLEAAGIPLAATADRVLILDLQGRLRVNAAADGRELAAPIDVGIPAWAVRDAGSPGSIEVDALVTGDTARITWSARRRYRGGAPPPAQVLERAQTEMRGTAALDLRTGEVLPAPPAPQVEANLPTPEEDAPLASSDPSTVALQRLGDRLYALKAEIVKGRSVIVLDAHKADTQELVWRVILDEQPPARPARLRN